MYRRITKSLALATSDKAEAVEVVAAGQTITEVFLTKMPTGVTIQLMFGRQGDPIDIDDKVSFAPDDDEQELGLYLLNPVALPGTSVDIYVSGGRRQG